MAHFGSINPGNILFR